MIANFIDSLRQDIAFGLRMIYKNWKFTSVVVLCLALGIGPNTTVFSLLNAVLIRTIDVADIDRMVLLRVTNAARGPEFLSNLNTPEVYELGRDSQTLDGVTAVSFAEVSIVTEKGTQLADAQVVTESFFDVFGRTAMLGDTFHASAEDLPGAVTDTVLSYDFWISEFDGDQQIIGRSMTINDVPFTIVGVMPKRFTGSMIGLKPDMWVPMMMIDTIRPDSPGRIQRRGERWLLGFGRIRDGVDRAAVQQELDGMATRLAEAHPNFNTNIGFLVQPMQNLPGMPTGMLQTTVRGMTVLIAIVLLVACTSVAAMLLARATERRQEIAVRLALGASRWRVVRQLLVESALMALLAGMLALLLTFWSRDWFLAALPDIGGTLDLGSAVDYRVLLFTFCVSLAASFLFGLIPALRTTKLALMPALKDQPVSAVADKQTTLLRNGFMVIQFALAVFLLIVAGLFLKSMNKALKIDPGFDLDNLVGYRLNLGLYGYDSREQALAAERLRKAFLSIDGVTHVTYGRHLPLDNSDRSFTRVRAIDSETLAMKEQVRTAYTPVATDYFETVGLPLVKGRGFEEGDRSNIRPVVVLNEALADQLFPGEEPIGKFVYSFGSDAHEVVGVAKNARYHTIGEQQQTWFYIPVGERIFHRLSFTLRTRQAPDQYLEDIAAAAHVIDETFLTRGLRPMSAFLADGMWGAKMLASLTGLFGLLALTLAVIGVYGVVSYSINLRRQEIGIRLSLGAPAISLILLMLRGGLWLIAMGAMLGIGLAVLIAPATSGMLNGVNPRDPLILFFVPLFLAAIAIVSLWLPSRRQARMEPMQALRYE